jgi:hypothetical protein
MKPLKVAWWVVGHDRQAIYDYLHSYSPAKADRSVAEYGHVIAWLEGNPRLFEARPNQWRVHPFESGTYLLDYIETESFWLVAGLFHAGCSPEWIEECLVARKQP